MGGCRLVEQNATEVVTQLNVARYRIACFSSTSSEMAFQSKENGTNISDQHKFLLPNVDGRPFVS